MKSRHIHMTDSKSKVLLFFIYSIFLFFIISSFIKIKSLWGINFLYYQPLGIKLAFIIPGITVCVKPVNSFISKYAYSIIQRVEELLHVLKRSRTRLWIAAAILAALIASLLYIFRVVPLYHDSIQAVYFMRRDVSFFDYIFDTVYGKNKPGLYLFNGLVRFFFQSTFNSTPFWMLAFTSISLGILHFALLLRIVSELTGSTIQKVFAFIILSTQAISFYFFGYGNLYSIVPVLVLLYIYFLIRYFKGTTRFIVSFSAGLLVLLTHFGTLPIAASMGYMLVHRFRERFSRLFEIMSFTRPFRTLIGIFIVFGIPYIIIAERIIEVPYFSYAFVPLFSKPKLGYGWNLLSYGYLLHLINMLLLLSPIGIILFLHTVKRIAKLGSQRECAVALLWFAIGGFSILLFTSPQTLYAWDIYAWLSTGYVLLGAYVYIQIADEKNFSYRTALITVHSLLYFSAWIALNNNVHAAVLNYLDAIPKRFENQITVVLEAVNNDIRNEKDFAFLVSELETRAHSKEDFKLIFKSYEALKDTSNCQRIADKVFDLCFKAIKENPDIAYNYYELYRSLPESRVNDPANRENIEPYIRIPAELEPENLTYLVLYGMYLAGVNDNQKAYPILKRADSLYTFKDVSLFDSAIRHAEAKGYLALISYGKNEFLECVRYFEQYIPLKPRRDVALYNKAIIAATISYARLGNKDMAEHLLKDYHGGDINLAVIQTLAEAGLILRTRLLIEMMNNGGETDAAEFLRYAAKNTFIPDYEVFSCLVYLHDGEYGKLQDCISNILRHDGNFPAIHLLRGISLLYEENFPAASGELRAEKARMAAEMNCTWIDYTVLQYCGNQVEELATLRDIPRDIALLLKEFSLPSLLAADTPFARRFNLIHSIIIALKAQNARDLLSHIQSADKPVLETVDRLINNEVQLGHFMYQNAQSAIIKDRIDSLNIYAELMMDMIPDQFQGYFLKGIALKKARESDSAQTYFRAALDRLPNSSLLANPQATRERIESIMRLEE